MRRPFAMIRDWEIIDGLRVGMIQVSGRLPNEAARARGSILAERDYMAGGRSRSTCSTSAGALEPQLLAALEGHPGGLGAGRMEPGKKTAFCSWNKIQALLIFRLDGTEISQTAPLPWPGNPRFYGEGIERGE